MELTQGNRTVWKWLSIFRRPQQALSLGDQGESVAATYLEGRGFQILERQLRGRHGELDLVAVDGDTVVFVEVKTRATSVAGDPTEAVTVAKQKRITQSALAYLKRRRWLQRRTRFDVVSILWNGKDGHPEIRHYPAAFEAAGFGQLY